MLSLTEKTEDLTADTGSQTQMSGPEEEGCPSGEGRGSFLSAHTETPPQFLRPRGEDLEVAHLGSRVAPTHALLRSDLPPADHSAGTPGR